MSLVYFPIIVSLFAIAFVWFLISQNKKAPAELFGPKNEAAGLKSKKRYLTAGVIAIILFIFLLFLGWSVAIGFLFGVIMSALAVFGLSGILKNRKSLNEGLILGFAISGLGLLAVSIFYFLAKDIQGLIGFAFGLSLVSIFTKVLRQNIGVAAVAIADIFETYCVSMIATIILAALLFPRSLQFVFLPFVLASVSILALIISNFFIKFGKNKAIAAALILSAAGFYPVILKLMAGSAVSVNKLYVLSIMGLVIPAVVVALEKYPKFKRLALALLVIAGVGLGYQLAGFYGLALVGVTIFSIFPIIFGVLEFPIVTSIFTSLALFSIFFEKLSTSGVTVLALINFKLISGFAIGLLVVCLFFKCREKFVFKGVGLILIPILTGFILGAQGVEGLLAAIIIASMVLFFCATGDTAVSENKDFCIVALLIISFLV